MEPALRAVCKDVRIGKILIQTNQDTGEPEVHARLNLADMHHIWSVLESHAVKETIVKYLFSPAFVFLPILE